MYYRLPEDEPSGSKHVEDTNKLKIKNINLEKVHFVALYCIIILQYTLQIYIYIYKIRIQSARCSKMFSTSSRNVGCSDAQYISSVLL